jgi:hypothetical protein
MRNIVRLRWALSRLAAALVGVAIATAATADVRILKSNGGRVGDYLELFALVNASGQRVVIDGPCLSACTLVLSTVPKDRICTTRRAVLGFHAPYLPGQKGKARTVPAATRTLTKLYPAPVQEWIKRRGGLSSRTLILRGRELAALVPPCPSRTRSG